MTFIHRQVENVTQTNKTKQKFRNTRDSVTHTQTKTNNTQYYLNIIDDICRIENNKHTYKHRQTHTGIQNNSSINKDTCTSGNSTDIGEYPEILEDIMDTMDISDYRHKTVKDVKDHNIIAVKDDGLVTETASDNRSYGFIPCKYRNWG